ncbi:MAG: 1,4-alpha-glucan branching enzyme, partial [Chloroflexi bacterium]|nr:1,4-alpha-glucan branching enzyme [Chloroflexota bacterium]
RSFLISSALFWLDRYHADALRVDAVASMLYHDYSRKEGEWLANKYGGRHNLEAIDLLRRFNEEVYRGFPGAQTIAEESTAWPMVSRPAYAGGLGFGYKWDMGWMHDMLDYIATDPLYRRYHHHDLTFRMLYAFTENFILPLSHDEVVHGKGSLLGKMPGDFWQKFANLRLLFGYMYAQPGKKLLFMGGEFAQWSEWHHDESLEWHLLQYEPHHKLQKWLEDLNRTYRDEKPLHELDCEPAGFQWVNIEDGEQSVISFARKGKTTGDIILAVFNFTPVPRENYVMGAPRGGQWQLLLNSDREAYGGSNFPVPPALEAAPQPAHGFPDSLTMTLPPLAALLYKSQAA